MADKAVPELERVVGHYGVMRDLDGMAARRSQRALTRLLG